MIKIFLIGLSFFIAIFSTFLRIDTIIKRITLAIRKQDIDYQMNYFELSVFWTLFLLSYLI